MDNIQEQNKKTAFISILGRPNAGKSTLLNQIIGQKVSIVTPKVQTTRSIMKGIYTKDNAQLVFLDTPGIFSPKKNLEKAMVRSAWSSIAGADIICLLIDLSNDKSFDAEFEKIIKHLSELKRPILLLFNKIDLLKKQVGTFEQSPNIFSVAQIEDYIKQYEISEKLKSKITALKNSFVDAKALFISAKSNKNIKTLLSTLTELSPQGEWLYNEDEITTAPMRFLGAEITREQLFLKLHEELPYNLMVETEMWEQLSEKEAKVNQCIIVNRDAYKRIILGKGGEKIKEIGTQARIEMSKALDMKIHLFLFVKVREDWDNKTIYYNSMGLEFPKN